MSTAKAYYILTLLALVASGSCQNQCPSQMDADVLILGAGMAGLGAAETLSKNGINNFLIIDQRSKIGGRVQTEIFGGGIIEQGPQWLFVYDPDAPEDVRNPLVELVERCGVTLRDIPFGGRGLISYNSRGSVILQDIVPELARFQAALAPDIIQSIVDGLPEGEDMSVSEGLRIGGFNARTQLQKHAEHVAWSVIRGVSFPQNLCSYRNYIDPATVSLRTDYGPNIAIRVVTSGFFAIAKCVADEFLGENDPRLILETAIVEIEWSDECVCAISRAGRRFCAPYAIVTFSIGELQNGFVKFTPEMPFIKTISLNQYEMSHILKVYISFNETFWDTEVDAISYLNEERGYQYYPLFATWGQRLAEPTHVLEAVVFDLEESKRVVYQDPEITRREIGQVMRDIYGDRASEPLAITQNNFIPNPYFFGNLVGIPPNLGRRQFDELNVPLGNLYISGEGVFFEGRATVHGALIHGRRTAATIVELLRGPLKS